MPAHMACFRCQPVGLLSYGPTRYAAAASGVGDLQICSSWDLWVLRSGSKCRRAGAQLFSGLHTAPLSPLPFLYLPCLLVGCLLLGCWYCWYGSLCLLGCPAALAAGRRLTTTLLAFLCAFIFRCLLVGSAAPFIAIPTACKPQSLVCCRFCRTSFRSTLALAAGQSSLDLV